MDYINIIKDSKKHNDIRFQIIKEGIIATAIFVGFILFVNELMRILLS